MSSTPALWSKPLIAGSLASVLACGTAASARPIAFDQPGLQATTTLQVTVGDVEDGGLLPTNYTADGRDLSPPVSWSAGPPSTVSYAVVMEDADATEASTRWLAYDIPKGEMMLPKALHNLAQPTHPVGLMQGRNDHGGYGYAGPRPQPGDGAHRYHLEVFALDRAPRIGAGASLAQLERAMSGHVVACGERVVSYPAPPRPPKPGAPSAAPGPADGPPSSPPSS